MPKIAISYRRADTQQIVGRILDRLANRYGKDEVYIDIDNIPAGIDFRSDIDRTLHQVDVLLVVMGSQWRGPPHQEPPRIFAPDDPVRKEVETALARQTRIVPVLIDNTSMPAATALPDSLQALSFLNALPVDTGRDFENHIARLITALDQILGLAPPEPAPVDLSAKEEAATSALIILVKYLIVPAVLVAMAYYLIVYKLNLGLGYVYAASLIVTLPSGLLLSRHDKRGLQWAALLGVGAGIIAVAVMQAIGSLIDGSPFVPAGARDWQEASEAAILIAGGMFAGSLLDRLVLARINDRTKTSREIDRSK